MPSTTAYDFGDVVLVDFPYTNLQATKKRPAVIDPIVSRPVLQYHMVKVAPEVLNDTTV